MGQFKAKQAAETAKIQREEKILRIKEKNEEKAAKVAQRKAAIGADKERKRLELFEKEQMEMSPIREAGSPMMRTFNATSTQGVGFFKVRGSNGGPSMPNEKNMNSMRT